MRRVLGIFAKEARPGSVKTRLAAVLGPELAARLYDAFLRDLLPRLAELPFERVVAYTPDSAAGYLRTMTRDAFRLVPQVHGDLGTRMSAFFGDAFRGGADQAVLIGSDAPTMPLQRVSQAFESLDAHDAVIGPSRDGGYYLIGLARHIPQTFAQVDWSTDRVLEQTLGSLRDAESTVALLDPWYDVDEPADLVRLSVEFAAAGPASAMPHIDSVLRSIRESTSGVIP